MTTKIAVSPVVEILSKARELLERGGWCQGTEYNYRGQRCLVGAVYYVAPTYLDARVAVAALQRETDGAWPAFWNDKPGRTKEEVFELIDRVIAKQLGVPRLTF
jgi:hypothetical protein